MCLEKTHETIFGYSQIRFRLGRIPQVVEARWGRSPKRRISEEDEAWQADLIAVGTYRFLMLTISC